MTDLSLTFARLDGQVLVKIAGELDGYTAGQLSDALCDVIQGQGNRSLILDLADMTFIDSNGLNVLVRALQWTGERGGTITLAGPRPQAAKVFEIVGFDKVFSIAVAAAMTPPLTTVRHDT
jgi:anti-sigma B factor antagonist